MFEDPVLLARLREEFHSRNNDQSLALTTKKKNDPSGPARVPSLKSLLLKSEESPPFEFDSPVDEARARIHAMDLNSGGDIDGFKVLASVLDHQYGAGKEFSRIHAVPKIFEDYKDQVVSAYAAKLQAVKNYQRLLNFVGQSHQTGLRVVDESNIKILDTDKLLGRARELSEENYYGGDIKVTAKTKAFKTLPGPKEKWLTFYSAHYMQIVSVEKLRQGELKLYLKDLQHNDDRLYHFQINAEGKFLAKPESLDHASYLAWHEFMDQINSLAQQFDKISLKSLK